MTFDAIMHFIVSFFDFVKCSRYIRVFVQVTEFASVSNFVSITAMYWFLSLIYNLNINHQLIHISTTQKFSHFFSKNYLLDPDSSLSIQNSFFIIEIVRYALSSSLYIIYR